MSLLHVVCMYFIFTIFCISNVFGGQEPMKVYGSFGEGINFIAADSSFSTKIRLRFQSQINGQFDTEPDLRNLKAAALIRRMRLRFEGFALSTNLQYKVQLNGSNEDMESNRTPELDNPGILRDAVLQWTFLPGTSVWFGQTKLPGNRERVVSSANQEFVDRSNLNRTFNLDRDIGIQVHNQWNLGSLIVREAIALSTGEGRNRRASSLGGWCFTGKAEILPFGLFTNKGEYFQGDLLREPTPKLAIAASYAFNNQAVRTGGQLGEYLYSPSDISTLFADAIFKYQGLAVTAEYARRSSPTPISSKAGSKTVFIFDGEGINTHISYMITDKLQCGLRYTSVNPNVSIESLIGPRTDWTFVVGHYFKGHDLKIQGDISYISEQSSKVSNIKNSILTRIQTDFTF